MKKDIADLISVLEANHKAIRRDVSIYSKALDEIKRSHEFIREVAWRFSDFSNINWSDADVQAHVADFFGITVKEQTKQMEKWPDRD